MSHPPPLRLRLPATSANLGPGFDAAAVAFDFYLEIEAETAAQFSIHATGHNKERCEKIENNLILGIYHHLLSENARPVVPLAIRMNNDIPLGMGCGSSAAGRLAAILLAVHFGQLGWNSDRILEEVCALEGHPDNASACWLGGFITATNDGRSVYYVHIDPPEDWRAILAFPAEPLPTSKARSVLPETYSRADVVANVQSVSLLGLAFAQKRGDLLKIAMRDRIHQPFRAEMCTLLTPLIQLAGQHGILGAALSGAGPSVLVIVENESKLPAAATAIEQAVQALGTVTLKTCRMSGKGTRDFLESGPSSPIQ